MVLHITIENEFVNGLDQGWHLRQYQSELGTVTFHLPEEGYTPNQKARSQHILMKQLPYCKMSII